jgi:hypothetical protein
MSHALRIGAGTARWGDRLEPAAIPGFIIVAPDAPRAKLRGFDNQTTETPTA